MKAIDEPIVVPVEPDESGTRVSYHCEACGLRHWHGNPGGGHPGLRVSHCQDPKSPLFRQTVELRLKE